MFEQKKHARILVHAYNHTPQCDLKTTVFQIATAQID
jgi:hypothetical protein